MRSTAVVAAFCLACIVVASGQAAPVLVGILEDTPGQFTGQTYYRSVRVAFQRGALKWNAFPGGDCPNSECLRSIVTKFPAQVNWTIAFDGKSLGQVLGRTPSSFRSYSTVGQQEIVGGAAPPTIGKRSDEYRGWGSEPVYRPLVAVSVPYVRDPDGWKPARVGADSARIVRSAFRNRYPKAVNCANDQSPAKPWPYTDADITLNKAYESSRRWMLVAVRLRASKCDGPPDEPYWQHWFVVTPERQARFLDSDMWFVDAGDYDNDGRSELIFSVEGYNRGGYRLFYDDFKGKAAFEFGYH